MEGKARCCQNCKAPCAGDFKKVVDFQSSGLVIYLHRKKDEHKKACPAKYEDSYIIHNTSSKQLKRPEYISELHQFKTKCGQCKTIVQRVRSLLDEIRAIRENEVIGVCEHCKRTSMKKTCKRCDFIVSKFICLHQKKCEERRLRFKVWLCKVKHFLQAILDSEGVCQHRVYKDTELERFWRELKAPLSIREPNVDFLPSVDKEQLSSFKSHSENKDMIEELLGKIKFQGEKPFSSDESFYASLSKETCICKYLKEVHYGGESSGLGTEKSGRLSKDFSDLLSQDVFKKLIKRLVDLSKALPQELDLNYHLIQELIRTLDTAINQGLSTDIIKKLIKELSELSKTLTPDLLVDLNGETIHGLIKDLNELLTLGSSQDLNKDMIQLLVNLTELLTHKLSKSLPKEQSEMLSKSVQKDIPLVLFKNVHEDIEPESLHEEIKLGLPTRESTEIPQGSPKRQSKYNRQGLSGLDKEVTQGLPKGILKEVEQDSSRRFKKEKRHGSPKSQGKEIVHGISKSRDKEVTQSPNKEEKRYGSSKSQGKEIVHGISKSRDKEVTQGLNKEEKRYGSPKGQSKKMADGISKGLDKEVTQGPNKEEKRYGLPKGQSKKMADGISKGLDKEVTQGPNKEEKRYGSPKGQSKKMADDISKGLDNEVIQGPQKEEKTHGTPESKRNEMADGISNGLDKESTQDSSKEVTPALSKIKDLSKDIAQGLPKDVIKGKSVISLKDLNKTYKDIKIGPSSIKSSSIKTKETTESLSKDANNQLAKKLVDFNKALAGVNLDKELMQKLSSDINEKVGQGPPDLNKKIKHELTDLGKPAAQGISENLNTELIQSLPKDTSKAMLQGLPKDQNKKVVQELSKDLNKVTSETTNDVKSDLTKDLQKGISKTTSKGLISSGSSKKTFDPGSKDVRKKRQGDLTQLGSQFEEDSSRGKKGSKYDDFKDKQVSEFEEDILKKGKKSRKGSSKNKSLTGQSSKQTKRQLSTKEKENLSPEDENKTENKLKDGQSKSEQKTLSSEKSRNTSKMSESLILKILRDNRESLHKKKIQKEQELAKRKPEGGKLAFALKHLPSKKKIEIQQVLDDEYSESIVVCDIGQTRVPEAMVRGNKIVPYNPRYKDAVDMPMEPLIFKSQMNFPEPPIFPHTPKMETVTSHSKSTIESSIDLVDEYEDDRGVIRYRLSNRKFIDKGWTKLPTEKIMRKMNIYRMEPASPQYDWFERHKLERELFYDNGARLADIDDDGRGHWYYRNGAVALDYYNAEESNIGQRYVVYSSGEEMDYGRVKSRTVLALFDFLGNGVVYDHYGNIRLKYNQSEGLLIDPKIGPPGRWKWHTLNDPPVLQQVFINTRMEQRDHDLELLSKQNNENSRRAQPDVLAIELDNFVREKANKMLQKFKPFQIRMKAVKLNEQFALKILNQANIHLLFRDGVTNLKLNLGMLLISNEIIDTVTSEMADVTTPYDSRLPKTDSVENIQKILKGVRLAKLRSSSANTGKGSI